MGGFNDKEHRYFSVVPDRAENVFSGLIRVGLYELDEISTVKEFLVFEIVKVGLQILRRNQRPQLTTDFNFVKK